MSDHYAIPALPIEPIRPGTTVLVAGPSHAGTREVGLQMLSGTPEEGVVLVTTNQAAGRICANCRRLGVPLGRDRAAVVDCAGDDTDEADARVLPVSGPGDLTGIGMRFSDAARQFRADGIGRLRFGLSTLSTLVSFGELKSVSRFVHALTGRVARLEGLAVLQIDPTNHDDRTVGTLAQFCDARIDVRDTDEHPELRARGLANTGRNWTPFDLGDD